MKIALPLFLCSISFLSAAAAAAGDTLTASQPLRHGRTLVSPNGVYELGFFTRNGSAGNPSTYLGLWYKSVPDSPVVWVANRDDPIAGSTGTLNVSGDGRLVILDRFEKPIWSSSNKFGPAQAVARLLDSGNFVLGREGDDGDFIWQSFDFPTDTLLPGMKLGVDRRRGLDRFLRSWKSSDDPSSGQFSFRMDPDGLPEVYLWTGATVTYRSGPWNGLGFSGVPEMRPTNAINFTFTVSGDEVFYSYELLDKAIISRLVVNSTGLLQRQTYFPERNQWSMFWFAPKDQCDDYKECGPYGVCDANLSPVCTCADGFRPANPEAWSLRDGSGGCLRRTGIGCGLAPGEEGFLMLKNVKLPDTSTAFVDTAVTSLGDCEALCRRNCSCTAYANTDISHGGSGCATWYGDLYDVRRYADGVQNVYVRMAASDLEAARNGSRGAFSRLKAHDTIVAVAATAFLLLLGLAVCAVWKRERLKQLWAGKGTRRKKGPKERGAQDLLANDGTITSKRDYTDDSGSHEFELPLFDFETILTATDSFSEANKLGQGGFGIVYKGMLAEGQEIAVKRLSKTSGQGMDEFKNEVQLIARLQHRNLVRLLGCCIQMEEKMLIYEYMQHRSLDSILFNKERSSLLDWQRRFKIICGIARGLLYLHQDSRYRIIHRDLKASNILLDGELNPKISDFGMARIFGGDQTEANTCKVVGTYGYMSPEYAMDGLFSVKSDAFSFGVLVLEIISGKKNRGFYYSNSQHNLLGHAWGLWQEGKGLELVDPSAGDSYSTHEVLRCLQVALLCVQERAEDRPTMSTVVLMLSSETSAMFQPKHPGFCMGRNPNETDSSSSKQEDTFSVNQVTVTMIDPR